MLPNAEPLNTSAVGGGGAVEAPPPPAADLLSGALNGASFNSVPLGGEPPEEAGGEDLLETGAINTAPFNSGPLGGVLFAEAAPPEEGAESGALNTGPINAGPLGGGIAVEDEEPPPGGIIYLETVSSSLNSAAVSDYQHFPLAVVTVLEALSALDTSATEAGLLVSLQSSLMAIDTGEYDWIIRARDSVAAADVLTSQAEQSLRAISAVAMQDRIRAVWPVLAASVLELPDEATHRAIAIAALVESLVTAEVFEARREAAALVAVALSATDAAAPSWLAEVLEAIQAGDMPAAGLLQTVAATEALTLTVLAQQGAVVFLALADTVTAGDTLTSQAVHGLLVQELVRCTAELVLFGEAFTAVAVTTQGARPISTYLGWNFNAMARIGGRYFGTGEGGLYELTGDSDDGAEIAARIVTGEMDFGSPAIKRIQEAYLGYTAGGDLILKVIATHEGKVREFWYRAPVMVPGEVSETRIQVGKGLTSRYWQFELINTGGADFDIEVFDMTLLDLSRRI